MTTEGDDPQTFAELRHERPGGVPEPSPKRVTDAFNRPIRDLRISVTDRCNFRCSYCMPKELFGASHHFLPRADLLSFEEIARITRIFSTLGLRKIRLTGGEPLLRRDIERLVEMLAKLPGLEDLSLTTNGSVLSRERAQSLKDAGLKRLTISLDAIDDVVFKHMNDMDFSVAPVLAAIEHAQAVGLSPIKVNMVVKRRVNDAEILAMAEHFRGTPHILRFIEFMDVGNSNGWRLDDVVPAREIIERLSTRFALEPVSANYRGEVAKRWRYLDGKGEIGVIASVTQPFCGSCTRARLSAEGKLYTCLFASEGSDLRRLLRSDASEEYIARTLSGIWSRREDRYSQLRASNTAALTPLKSNKIEMSYIGG